MIHEKYKDPIKVSAVFNGRKVTPKLFEWGKHRYCLSQVLNVHSTFDGRERVYFFSVATDTEFFRLELHTETLQWFLVEHYQE
jgi:hypothetical protein